MTNADKLNQHLLRTLLLEGENGEKMLGAVRSFEAGKKTEEDHFNLINTLRKEVTRTTKDLLADSQLDTFINEVSQQI